MKRLGISDGQPMTPLDELVALLNEKSRRISVAEHTIEFDNAHGDNCVYVLELPGASPGSAGGRVGGIGDRKLIKLLCFNCSLKYANASLQARDPLLANSSTDNSFSQ